MDAVLSSLEVEQDKHAVERESVCLEKEGILILRSTEMRVSQGD